MTIMSLIKKLSLQIWNIPKLHFGEKCKMFDCVVQQNYVEVLMPEGKLYTKSKMNFEKRKKNKQTSSPLSIFSQTGTAPTVRGNLGLSVRLMCVCLDRGRKMEDLQKNHTDIERTHTLLPERAWESNLGLQLKTKQYFYLNMYTKHWKWMKSKTFSFEVSSPLSFLLAWGAAFCHAGVPILHRILLVVSDLFLFVLHHT